jgi:hypothetical protein
MIRDPLCLLFTIIAFLAFVSSVIGLSITQKKCEELTYMCPVTTQHCPDYNDPNISIVQYQGLCSSNNSVCVILNCTTEQCLEGSQSCGYPPNFIASRCVSAFSEYCPEVSPYLWGTLVGLIILSGISYVVFAACWTVGARCPDPTDDDFGI